MADLGIISKRFKSESDWILDKYINSLSKLKTCHYPDRSAQLENEMCIIRVHDAWARFCRDLVFSSSIGAATTSGVILKPVIVGRSFADFMQAYQSTFRRPPRFEPKWANASDSLDAAQRVGVKNFATISAVLAAANSPADDLRKVRNYYAHRVPDTANKIKTIPWVAASRNLRLTPVDIPGALTTGGISYFEQWIRDLQLNADLAVM
ncbi:TPA: hypothetical protein RUX00_003984 [Aeromonas dhakensis]|nr:hypothetical protein [Aeromonas dhakensis]